MYFVPFKDFPGKCMRMGKVFHKCLQYTAASNAVSNKMHELFIVMWDSFLFYSCVFILIFKLQCFKSGLLLFIIGGHLAL